MSSQSPTAAEVLDRVFLEVRCKLLDTAASLDRIARSEGAELALRERRLQQIQEAIARDGFFARVPAGRQFYLYVTETIDQGRGTRGNVANAEIWRKAHEKN